MYIVCVHKLINCILIAYRVNIIVMKELSEAHFLRQYMCYFNGRAHNFFQVTIMCWIQNNKSENCYNLESYNVYSTIFRYSQVEASTCEYEG